MSAAFTTQRAMLDNIILLASRLLLAGIFVHEGWVLATNFHAASAGMAKLGVSEFLFVPAIALQLVAGSAIAIGWYTRLGALALGLFCIVAAVLFHTNFANRNELLHFEKDFAIAGGMFVLALCGAGGWSLEGRSEQRSEPDDD
jgi:putative oxidoreductase